MELKIKKISAKGIVLIVAMLLILSLLIFAAATDSAGDTVTCPDCVAGEECETCGDEGVVRGDGPNKHFSEEGYKWLMVKYEKLLENL